MNDRLTIGQLSQRTGVPVRTIRFWSDAGLVPEPARSAGGYRLYDAEAMARLDLVRTLREIGLDLGTIRRVLARQTTLAEVVQAHLAGLDAEIRTLTLRRAVLRSVAQRTGTVEEMRLMHQLARLSAVERQQILDDFTAEVFEGLPHNPIADAMRQLPADPTVEQVDAWIELGELVQDSSFRQRVRQMATAPDPGKGGFEHTAVIEAANAALADGIAPQSPEGQAIVARLVEPGYDRDELADKLAMFTDRRVERFWRLLGVLNDRPPFGEAVAPFEWFIAGLRG